MLHRQSVVQQWQCVWARRQGTHTRTRAQQRERERRRKRERDKQCCVADEFVRHVGGERSEAGDLATPQPGPPLLPDRPSVAQRLAASSRAHVSPPPPTAIVTACGGGFPCFTGRPFSCRNRRRILISPHLSSGCSLFVIHGHGVTRAHVNEIRSGSQPAPLPANLLGFYSNLKYLQPTEVGLTSRPSS